MKLTASRKSFLIIAMVLTIAFVSLTLMGPTHALGMQSGEGGQQVGCVFDGMTEVCSMNLPQHISAWQTLFAATFGTTAGDLFAALILFALSLAFVFVRRKYSADIEDIIKRQIICTRLSLAFVSANPLKEALSQGILNPKTY